MIIYSYNERMDKLANVLDVVDLEIRKAQLQIFIDEEGELLRSLEPPLFKSQALDQAQLALARLNQPFNSRASRTSTAKRLFESDSEIKDSGESSNSYSYNERMDMLVKILKIVEPEIRKTKLQTFIEEENELLNGLKPPLFKSQALDQAQLALARFNQPFNVPTLRTRGVKLLFEPVFKSDSDVEISDSSFTPH